MARKIHGSRKNSLKPEKLCDPGICDCCQYIGEGDFLCDKYMEIVVSDWEPAESYLMCRAVHWDESEVGGR